MTTIRETAEASAEAIEDGDTNAKEFHSAMADAADAIGRATTLLGPPADPLTAAIASALACANALVELHRDGRNENVAALRDAVGAARALVGEVTYALRDQYGTDRQ